MTDEPDDVEYELVMPFVVCTDHGGPYDPDAFTAGWECGALDQRLATLLEAGATTTNICARTASWPQVELIAMRYCASIDIVKTGATPEWTEATVRFRPDL